MMEKNKAKVRIVASRDSSAIRRCCRWRTNVKRHARVERVSRRWRLIIIA